MDFKEALIDNGQGEIELPILAKHIVSTEIQSKNSYWIRFTVLYSLLYKI